MNIRIQVMANQARQAIQQVQGDISKLSSAQAAGAARTAGAAGGVDAWGRSLMKSGSQLQWVGRQLSYNFTLPILAAAAAGVKFSNDNTKAMVELIKVYGDGTMAAGQLKSETDALGRTFEAMSEIYGVSRDQVISIGAAWASAGSSGLALAKQTKITMDAMILGNLDAATATQALIAIQAQFGQSADQLQYTIAQLNAIENQTGTTMGDLIIAMSRSAGVAKAAGVDVAHLAAMTAALVPAAGSAAQAGNALKTIISRLLSPTKDAQDLLKAMGINMADMSWKSADATTRLQILAKHFEGLSDAQKQVVSSSIASRLQLNKFDVLMDALTKGTSYYNQALKAVGDGMDAQAARAKVMNIYWTELQTVLDSSPNKFARMKVMLQNTLADAIEPMIPMITALGMAIASIAKSFNSLPLNVQKDIIVFALMLAAVGPLVTKFGALKDLLGILFIGFGKILGPLLSLTGLIWKAVAAVGGFIFTAVLDGLAAMATGFIAVSGIILGPFALAFGYIGRIGVLAISGMLAAVRTTLLLGMTSITSILYGAFSVLFVGIADIIAASPLGAAWEFVLGIIGSLTATFGAVLGRLWMIIGTTLEVITAEIGSGLARVWQLVMTTVETVLVAGARALGIAWRAALVGIEVITAEVGSGIAGLWRALQALLVTIQVAGGALLRAAAAAAMAGFEAILIATATIAGAIWRALQATLAAIQAAGSALLEVVTVAGGRLLALAWAGIGAVVGGIWEAATGGLLRITKIVWANIVMATKLFGPELLSALASPWVLGAAAVAAILYLFRDQLKGIWDGIVKFFGNVGTAILQAFNMLPKGVQSAIMSVVNMIKSAALAVYHWFSYLNPFAHHSPSLVENVTNGMAVVRAQFGTLTSIKGPIDSAYASIKQFKNAAADLANGYDSIKTANEVADLQKAGASPDLINSYVSLAGQLANLKNIQDQYDSAVKAQQSVVDGWQQSLDAANKELDTQKNTLSDLKDVASAYQDQISALKDNMSTLTNTPIQGMQAFDDAIFANQQAQKQLQLQMDQLQQSGSTAFASLADEASALQGQIETVMGSKQNARAMGAGSEILNQYDDQIKALQAQKKALGTAADNGTSQVANLQKQLDDLSKQGDILDLQKSLQFDGLTRQIDQAANAMQELPFQAILDGVNKDKAGIADLTTKYNAANDAVNQQQSVVDAAQKSVDAIQASYDAANNSLSNLKDQYDQVTQAIQDMSQAMSDAHDAATSLTSAKAAQLSPTMQNFTDAAGGDFPDVGGSGMVGREGGAGDQSAQIDQWTADLQKKMGSAMGGFDMLGPFKDAWKSFTGWWDKTAMPWIDKLSAPFKHVFDGVNLGGSFSNMFSTIDFKGILSKAWNILTTWWSTIWDVGAFLWKLIGPDVQNILGQLGDFFKKIWNTLGDLFSGLKERIGPFLEAIGNIINFLKPVVEFFAAVFVVGIKAGFDLLVNILKPILDFISNSFKNFVNFLMGILDIFIGLFTGDWGRFWNGIKEVLGAIWNQIVNAISLALGLLWAPIKTVLGWIGDLFSWLWTSAIKPVVGWIVDGWHALGTAIGWVYDNIIHPYIMLWVTVAQWLWNNILKPVFGWIADGWHALGTGIGWVFDNVIKPVWNAVQSVANWLWNNVLSPVFSAIAAGWDALATGFRWIHDHVIVPVFDAFTGAINAVHDGFGRAVDGMGKLWDGLKSALGGPVQWVVDLVWNNGLRKLWNVVNNLWGGGDIGEFKLNFANGGVMPGYTPGRDVHKFISPTGGQLELSGGEAVMRPEFTRALGPSWVNGANAAARNGGSSGVLQFLAQSLGMPTQSHKRGGIIDLPGWLTWPLKFIPGGSTIKSIIDNLNSSDGFGAGNWGDRLWGMAKAAGSDIWQGVKSFFGGNGDGSGGGGTGTDGVGSDQIKSFIRSVDPLPYIWGGVGPNGYDCSGLAGEVFALMTGRPSYRRYFTTGSIGSGAQFGFKPGLGGTLNLGFNDHHVVGEYGGLGFEAQSTATGILTGSKATPPSTMPNKMHLAYGGVIPESVINDLKRQKITVGGDPSNPVFGPNFYPGGKDAKSVAKKLGLFDQGGLMDGVGVNLSGRPERVLSPYQTASFEKLVNVLDRIDLVKLDARLNGSETTSQPVVYNYNGDTVTININGDLSFPSINNGRDAETFITNLRDMAGGSRR